MCIKQASLLNELRSRLVTAGFPAIDFTIINTYNSSDEYYKLKEVSSDIPVYQEKVGDKIFEKFGAEKDHILVADRCNRLTYQVIMPWSILHYPYVKAAILSTYKDDPCGKCPVKDSSEEESEEHEMSKFNKTSNAILDETAEDEKILDVTDIQNSTSHTTEESKTTNVTENIFSNVSNTTLNIGNSSEVFTPGEESENVLSRPINDSNIIEDSVEIPLSWSTTSDHTFLNSKNNYGNDIEDSLINTNRNESQQNNSTNSTVKDEASIEIQNRTYDEINFIPTHRSPALDEIIDIELSENPQKSMYWQKHIKQKKNKKDHEKKNEIKTSPATTPIPIRIIFRNSHKHSEENDDSEYVVLKTNDPSYHGHLDGKSYYYKEEKLSDEDKKLKENGKNDEIRTIIPGRFNIEESKEKAENIPWYYDSNESWGLKVDNEVQKGSEDLMEDKEKNKKPIQDGGIENVVNDEIQNMGSQGKPEADEKLVSHYSKLLYWVNYSI